MSPRLHFLALQLLVSLTAATGCAAVSNGNNSVEVPAVWGVFGYLFNITVGNPAQELTVLSDWTWMSLFVRSGRCMNQLNPSLCVGDTGQAYFDERDSTTFRNTSLPQSSWPVTAFAPNFTVDYGTDRVCVGKVCTRNTIFQLSNFPYPGDVIPKVPFGGIYGMAPVTPHLNETSWTANYQAWQAGRLGPRVGWNSCATLGTSKPCLGGEAKFVLGGTDTTLYDADEMRTYAIQNPSWLSDAFYPVTPPRNNYWSTALTGSWIRGSQHSENFVVPFNTSDGGNTNPLALLDEGSEGLGAPLSSNAYKWLVHHVNGSLASNATIHAIATQGSSGYNMAYQDWYTVPCDGTDSYPELVYEMDGRTNYTILPKDYVVELDNPSGRVCYLSINVWKYGRTDSGDAKIILLGGAFLKRLYVVLDFENLSFGFAPLKSH